MGLYDYMMAGYENAMCYEPPYASSPNHMAFIAGLWCREHNVTPQEITSGRGYRMVVNRRYVLHYGRNDSIVSVATI